MPKVKLFNMQGKKVGEVSLSDSVFGIEPNLNVLHEVVVNQLANKRQGTQSALTRAEVSGALVMQDKVLLVRHSGAMVVWYLRQSLGIIGTL